MKNAADGQSVGGANKTVSVLRRLFRYDFNELRRARNERRDRAYDRTDRQRKIFCDVSAEQSNHRTYGIVYYAVRGR